MAKYGIFNSNKLIKIAADENARDDHLSRWVGAVAKEINDTQWNAYFNGSKTATLSGDTITDVDLQSNFVQSEGLTEEQIAKLPEHRRKLIQQIIDDQVFQLNNFFQNNTDASWSDYLSKLQSVDVANITPPESGYFQEWFNSNYGSTKSILELP